MTVLPEQKTPVSHTSACSLYCQPVTDSILSTLRHSLKGNHNAHIACNVPFGEARFHFPLVPESKWSKPLICQCCHSCYTFPESNNLWWQLLSVWAVWGRPLLKSAPGSTLSPYRPKTDIDSDHNSAQLMIHLYHSSFRIKQSINKGYAREDNCINDLSWCFTQPF